MAWSPLPEALVGGETTHIDDHNQIHAYLNDENEARGIQHVDVSYGNDANSGSYGHPIATLAQAATNLGSTGGSIRMGGGTYPADDIVFDAPTTLTGVGRGKTIVSTSSTADRGFWLKGAGIALKAGRTTLSNFTHQGSTSASATTRLLDVDTADWVLVDNIDYRSVGYSRTDNPARSASPVAIYTSCTQPFGTGTISDWLTIRSCQFYNCFRGTVLTGCGNGYVTNCTWVTGVRDQIYASGNSWHFNTGWVVGGGNGISGEYFMRIGGSAYHTIVENFHWETVNAYPGIHHIIIEDSARRSIISNNVFRAHDSTATYCVDITDTSTSNVVGPYVLTGNGKFRDTSAAKSSSLWQPSDYTGTFLSS
jgi:hypothetical protein